MRAVSAGAAACPRRWCERRAADTSCIAILVAVAVLACSVPGAAQPRPDPREGTSLHAGPFYLAPAFQLEELGIDTNVFNDTEARRDFTVTLVPRLDVRVPFARRALITTALKTDLVYYQTYASERSVDPELRVRGEIFLNRLTLFAEPGYLRTRQRLNFEVDARARREEREMQAGMALRLGRALAVELAGRIRDVDFDAGEIFDGTSLRETLNRGTRSVSATVRRDLTPLTAVLLRAERSEDRFALSPSRDADTLRVTPGLEFQPGALVSGTAYVGVRRLTPRGGALPPFEGVVTHTALNYTLKDATRFVLTAERDLSYSYEPTQPYFVVHGYGLTIERRVAGRVDVTLGALTQQHAYRDILVPGEIESGVERVDRVRTGLATLGYRFTRSARLGFGASYRSRRSNSDRHRDYDGIRFLTTATYGF